MRRIALPLALALLSLAFAPAPLPKRDRETPQKKEERLFFECCRRLDELRVTWRVEGQAGWRSVWFEFNLPGGGGAVLDSYPMSEDDLPRALRGLIRTVENVIKIAGE